MYINRKVNLYILKYGMAASRLRLSFHLLLLQSTLFDMRSARGRWSERASSGKPPIALAFRSSKTFIIIIITFAIFTVSSKIRYHYIVVL